MAPSTTRAPKAKADDARSTRTSARVATNAEEPVTTGKGKKRAMAPPDAPKPKKAKAPTQPAEAPRAKRNKARSSGVTNFWHNNSSIAGRAAPSKKKDFMSSGMYCQDPDPNSPRKLVNRVLSRRAAEVKAARKRGQVTIDGERPVFPPMPYDYGETLFFEQEHEFVLPYDIQWAAENGTLDAQKRPDPYQRIRQNAFPERAKMGSNVTAICRCTQTGCNDTCDNRIMHYTCGKDCPAGDACNNKSLWKRKQPSLKVAFAGPRGFGLFAGEDIHEGDFVIDYRGEVSYPNDKANEIIALSTFYDRCNAAASKNYYALAYDQDEVIDAGTRGNEARFINHGCQPNLEVRKLSTLGDGVEEFEVGMWASRDIAAGEELYYDYNFDSFAAATATECKCGADNCVGYLGRDPGEKSAREKALEAELSDISRQAVKKHVKRAVKAAARKASVKPQAKAGKGESRETAAALERNKRVKQRQLRELQALRVAELEAKTPVVPEVPQKPARSRGGRKPKRIDPLADPEEEEARKEEARKRRISGWADWLKKKASEKSRTREEWQDFANKRRRGKAWMEGMMQEYGVAEYDGGPAQPYTSAMLTDIPATLQPKRRGPPPGTPRAPRAPKPEAVTETDAERALRSIYPDIMEAEPEPEPEPALDFDSIAVEELFGPPSVDYFETQQRYGPSSSRNLSQQSNARTETSPMAQPYYLAQIEQAVAAQAEEALHPEATEEQTEELRQRAIAIVSSIQPVASP